MTTLGINSGYSVPGPGGGGGGVDPVVASTLAATSLQSNNYAFAPTLSITAGAGGGVWSTVITRVSDGASVSVTSSTSTTPTATLAVANTALGDAFRCISTYTAGSLVGSYTSVVNVAAIASYANIPWVTADLTDGSWTLTDPDSLVNGVTYAAGFNKVTMNALAAGSTDYAWGGGATHRAPRYHKLLDASGVQVDSDGITVLQVRMTKGSTVTEFSTEVVCGACLDPTSTVPGTMVGQGGMMEYVASDNTGYGAWTVNSKGVATFAANDSGVMTAQWAARRASGTTYVTIDNTGVFVASGSRNANSTLGASTNMSLMIGVGTRGSATITAGADTNVKIEYRVLTFDPS